MSIKRALLGLGLALTAAACSSDASTICAKLDECNVLAAGVSKNDCEEQAEKSGTDSERSDCADCLDSKSCSTIVNGGCSADCAALLGAD